MSLKILMQVQSL